jgi:hypothetical protein
LLILAILPPLEEKNRVGTYPERECKS